MPSIEKRVGDRVAVRVGWTVWGWIDRAHAAARRTAEALRLAIAACRGAYMRSKRARPGLADEEGQGTTEYAILVGVLVVIAILAITLFRGKIQTLWDSIASAINSL